MSPKRAVKAKAVSTLALTVRCIGYKFCKSERVIYAGTPEAQEQPFCDKCYRPMIAHSAKAVITPKERR